VGYDPVLIHSDITLKGHFLREGEAVQLKDTETGQLRLDIVEDERDLPPETLTQDWTAPDRDRKIVEEVVTQLLAQEQEKGHFPKTLVFAHNDLAHRSHAEQLVAFFREALGRGDEFVQKITGAPNVDRPLQKIRQFRNRPEPGVVVTSTCCRPAWTSRRLRRLCFCGRSSRASCSSKCWGAARGCARQFTKTGSPCLTR
jgi:type I restriction enzyme R subunit